MALDVTEAHHHVGRKEWLHLKEVAIVEHGLDDGLHVIRLVVAVRDKSVESEIRVRHLEVGLAIP